MDALSDIAEDVEFYAINERCDVVPRELCFSEWMSLPGGDLGKFNAMEQLEGERRKTYGDIRRVLVPEGLAEEAASRTGAFVGMTRPEYIKLVRRMLNIGMSRLRRKVKSVNGIFGVWKERPGGGKKVPSRKPGKGRRADAPCGPEGPATSPPAPDCHGFDSPGKIRLIIDMRRGNCFFMSPDKVELVTPSGLAQIHLDPEEIMVMSKADLDNYFYRCRVPEAYWEYFGLPAVTAEELGATEEEMRRWTGEMGDFGGDFHPVMCVLPMGWSHAPLVAQEAHENLLGKTSELVEDHRLRESQAWRGRKWCHFCYIDDTVVFVIGPRKEIEKLKAECNRLMAGALGAYADAGIPVKPEKVEEAATVMVILGLTVDG